MIPNLVVPTRGLIPAESGVLTHPGHHEYFPGQGNGQDNEFTG